MNNKEIIVLTTKSKISHDIDICDKTILNFCKVK